MQMIKNRLHHFSKNIFSDKGFTLIEIMIAVTIIAILGALVVPRLMDLPQRARVVKVKGDIGAFQLGLARFSNDNASRYPSTEEGLQKLVEEKYIDNKKGVLLDPWGQPYNYRYPGEFDPENPEIWSLGADGKEGGEGYNADIKSWE